MMVEYSNAWAATHLVDSSIATKSGQRRRESTQTEEWDDAQRKLVSVSIARDDRTLEVVRRGEQMLFQDWAAFFLENYSKPPIRAAKTHEANMRALGHLQQAFGRWRLADLTADEIEQYLRRRLKQHARSRLVQVSRNSNLLKPTTVHQEFRVLRRNTQCRRTEEVASGQSLRGCRVPRFDQRSVPAALRSRGQSNG